LEEIESSSETDGVTPKINLSIKNRKSPYSNKIQKALRKLPKFGVQDFNLSLSEEWNPNVNIVEEFPRKY